MHWRWEVEAENTLTGLLLPLVHPLLARSMQQDLDALAKGSVPKKLKSAGRQASLAGPGIIVLVAVSIFVIYLLRRRSRTRGR